MLLKSNKIKIFLFVVFTFIFFQSANVGESGSPLSPCDVKFSKDGQFVYIAERTGHQVQVIDLKTEKIIKTLKMPASPNGLVLGNKKLYVTCSSPYGHIVIIDTSSLKIIKTIKSGHGSCAPVLSKNEKRIYICYQFKDEVGEIDLESGKELRRIKVLRQPYAAVLGKNGKYLFVANLLPATRADIDVVAADVSIINMETGKKVKDIKLDNGSNALRGMCISPDGKHVYITHNLGRFLVPTTQLERGWMNTSAISIIQAEKLEYVATVLLDDVSNGAAGSWGSMVSPDNQYVYVAHSGTHEISVIDQKKMLQKISETEKKKEISINLTFLYDIRKRIKLDANGPRLIDVHQNKIITANYFTDSISLITVKNMGDYGIEKKSIPLNPDLQMSKARKGEMYFHDAQYCFQQWQSCTGCHPNDARVDGLNWDLLNDGLGNPKNCKNMLLAHKTPPAMITGIRESAEVAVRAGFKYIQFSVLPEDHYEAVDEYLKSLTPVPSPYLVNGQLSESAKNGKKVFSKAGCIKCHHGEYYTDMKKYDLGEGKGLDAGKEFDTPTLIEVWRSGPYLYDGRANTVQEVISEFKHGSDIDLTDKEIKDLAEYILSL
jgi:DNA-binding beta-propeller fold protein YncE/cytochrome c551/c552